MQGRIKKNLLPSAVLLFCLIVIIEMAESGPPQAAESAVHIVYTERPQDEESEAFHLRILSSVLGSEEAAKDALVYSYNTVASGFSAKLSPQQVEEISKHPGVLQVVPSRTLQLHSGHGNHLHSRLGKLQ